MATSDGLAWGRGDPLFSHPFPIQPNCMDGSGAHRKPRRYAITYSILKIADVERKIGPSSYAITPSKFSASAKRERDFSLLTPKRNYSPGALLSRPHPDFIGDFAPREGGSSVFAVALIGIPPNNFPQQENKNSQILKLERTIRQVLKLGVLQTEQQEDKECYRSRRQNVAQASTLYKFEEKKTFGLMHCWDILHEHPKWNSVVTQEKQKTQVDASPMACPCSNLDLSQLNAPCCVNYY
uniref:No apical meristem-associated C-terminal domain-containing protein n=1 Tax=Leersia perrieri TaxID=77586 RepID=A0A0D9W0D7_9ORYZ